MGITHVIRGADHLRNAFRQKQIYDALGWTVPKFAHVPLILGADGAKMSKRHGAIGVEQYRELGYLPEALRNYLLRLGWSHGDDEIISTEEAIEWFDLNPDVGELLSVPSKHFGVFGRSPARFDQAKLDDTNAHYIREADDGWLVALVGERLEREFARELAPGERDRLARAMPGLKPRARTIVELAEKARFYIAPRPIRPAPDAAKALTAEARARLGALAGDLAAVDWQAAPLEGSLRRFAEAHGLKLGAVAQPLRAALTGSLASPGIFEVMEVLGRDESLARIDDAAGSPDRHSGA
jgi:glutamyl-tRNA synthetase